jgi:hypothetical protein
MVARCNPADAQTGDDKQQTACPHCHGTGKVYVVSDKPFLLAPEQRWIKATETT